MDFCSHTSAINLFFHNIKREHSLHYVESLEFILIFFQRIILVMIFVSVSYMLENNVYIL